MCCAVEERLRIVDAYLQEFEARPVDSTVKPQPLFKVGVDLRTARVPAAGAQRAKR
jgi:hypothetical protein